MRSDHGISERSNPESGYGFLNVRIRYPDMDFADPGLNPKPLPSSTPLIQGSLRKWVFIVRFRSTYRQCDYFTLYYWVTQKLPQIYTANHATFPIRIRKITVRFAVTSGSPSSRICYYRKQRIRETFFACSFFAASIDDC